MVGISLIYGIFILHLIYNQLSRKKHTSITIYYVKPNFLTKETRYREYF